MQVYLENVPETIFTWFDWLSLCLTSRLAQNRSLERRSSLHSTEETILSNMMQPVVTDVPWSVFVCLLVMTVSCAKVAEPVEMLSVCVVCTEPVCTLACALLLFLAVVSHCSLCWLSAVTESLHQCIRHRHSPCHLSETAGSWLRLQGTCLLCLFIRHVSFIRHLQKDMQKYVEITELYILRSEPTLATAHYSCSDNTLG